MKSQLNNLEPGIYFTRHMSRVTRHASRVTRHLFRVTLLLLISFLPARAAVRLPSILASGMVLQQNSVVNIWGWADAGERIVVEASWLVEKPQVVAGADGKWRIRIPTGAAGGPHSITVTGANRIVLSDVLFGEVWVCSGQSNMEYTINMLGGWKHYKADRKDLNSHDYSAIRLCQVKHALSPLPADTCSATWRAADERSVADFSATAFFFARTLHNLLHVPIGLISSNWGGTPAEAWTERSFLAGEPELGYFLNAPNGQTTDSGKPSWLYNAMISPLLNYTIRGVIWYQGETNIHEAGLYRQLFTATIGSWRKAWGLGDFPFYFVQIAPYDYHETTPWAAFLREAQLESLSVPNTGMVVTLDIGDPADIHPKNKQEVGLRLALCALANTYRQPGITYAFPIYRGVAKEGDRMRIFLDNARDGLSPAGKTLHGFSVAGADGNFRNASAAIEDSTVLVWSDSVKEPVNVRYAFTNAGSATLFSMSGLPVPPFRSDTSSTLWRNIYISYITDSVTLKTTATLACLDPACTIRYTRDGSIPDQNSALYSHPLNDIDSVPIIARAFKGDQASEISNRSQFVSHLGLGQKMTVSSKPSPKYTGGKNCLLDGIRGSVEFWDNHWQGFQGVDFTGVVDLGRITEVRDVSIGFLRRTASWIFLPEFVKIEVSSDGVNYRELPPVRFSGTDKNSEPVIRDYNWLIADNIRYIRILAKNIGTCPKWHPGKGGRAWIFTDEIVINQAIGNRQ
jgi:sialate O-acetylesterase